MKKPLVTDKPGRKDKALALLKDCLRIDLSSYRDIDGDGIVLVGKLYVNDELVSQDEIYLSR